MVAGATIFCLAALEIGLRIYYHRHDVLARTGFHMLWHPLFASLGQPGSEGPASSSEWRYTLRANAEGFRENLHDLSKTGSIVVLGDSYVWGTGLEETQRFSNILSDLLATNVLNYGLCTDGTINELAVYAYFAEKRKPSQVILAFYANDVQNNLWWLGQIGVQNVTNPAAYWQAMAQRARIPASWPDEANLIEPKMGGSALGYFVREALRKMRAQKDLEKTVPVTLPSGATVRVNEQMIQGDHYLSPALTLNTQALDYGWKMTATTLGILKKRMDDQNVKFLVVYIPLGEKIHPDLGKARKKWMGLTCPDELLDPDRPRRDLEKIARELHIDFLDLTPALSKEIEKTGAHMCYPFDWHLTPAGNRVVAQALAEHLRGGSKPE